MVHSFGPGSLVDLPDDSIIMGGLEEWRYGEHEHQCRITEVRLLEKVKESLDRADIRHATNCDRATVGIDATDFCGARNVHREGNSPAHRSSY